MANRYQRTFLALLLLAAVLGGASARAEPGGDEALKRAQLIMRKLQQEKQTLSDQVSALTKDNVALKDAVAKLERERNGARRSTSAVTQELKEAQDAQVRKEQEASKALQEQVHRSESLTEAFVSEREAVQTCEAKNFRLYQLSREALQKYRDKGVVDALLAREPFTQLKQVELESFAEEYRNKMDAQKIERNADVGAQ